jgi:hypothetical protein
VPNPGKGPAGSGGGGAPSGTPAGTQTAAKADFDSWKDWTDPASGNKDNAERAIGEINAALPSLKGQDHARALYYLGSAQLLTGRTTAACKTFTTAKAEATGSLAAIIDPFFTADGAPCKP